MIERAKMATRAKFVRIERKAVHDPERACGCKCDGGCNAVPRVHCGRWWCEFDRKPEGEPKR